ncbi:MAG: neutral/alkaline non-lysosomal ceramidase N-terminal domain-containing protein [Verrucomicrobia bacterium]|nr:neutral/alkaline non-lysosomal ceramidase N-terminal domain-containing protein [Verrucomicrobiota bacterium]
MNPHHTPPHSNKRVVLNRLWLLATLFGAMSLIAINAAEPRPQLQVGVAARDVTPNLPIWLAGYAARKKPADKIDHPLLAQAMAFKDASGERFVFVSLDNCEVSHAFVEPVTRELQEKHGLARGQVMIVSSHTHSAPVLADTLETMYHFSDEDRQRVRNYSRALRGKLVEVVGAALADLKPAQLEHGLGRASFAMNRRVYRDDGIAFGENPDGPVEWDVNVLKVKGTNNTVRAVLFGYACHGTSIAGDDFYIISGDYMAYAREQIEALHPGALAMYVTGMGADSNPSPRGTLLDAKRHGVELAGAVLGVLNRPMRPVGGKLKLAYEELDLPFEDSPERAQLEKDAQSKDVYVKTRAEAYLKRLEAGEKFPAGIKLPLAAVRIGNDLTFVAMGGEVVVDYDIRFKRLFAADYPWMIGYAYEVPCYIPSVRILKEGGYEAQSSLIYYGFYGPFRTRIESLLLNKMTELVGKTRNP